MVITTSPFTTLKPSFKAGIAAEAMGQAEKALAYYKDVKENYANAPEAAEIDKYITRIENK